MIEKHVRVSEAANKDIFLLVNRPIKDGDDVRDPTQGFEFPIGKYYLEAEDDNYWYFRAPRPLVLAVYDLEGKTVNGLRIPGGIALSKTGDNKTPTPCVYVDDQNKASKIQLWTLSAEFMKVRGDKWRLFSDAGASGQ
jgi:hypothetical protein